MSAVINQFNGAVDSIPFYGFVSGVFEDKVGEKYKTKDPFYEEVPKKLPSQLKKGEKMPMKQIRRQPPPNITPEQRKLWKKVMKRAWYHDRNFCGCMPINLGLGMITIVSIFPFIGSAIAYRMHYKLIKMCHQAGVPAKLKAEMVGNIGVDFMKTLIPLLGVLLSWVQASSTKNAAIFDTWLRRESMKKEAAKQQQAGGNGANGTTEKPGNSQNASHPSDPTPPAPAKKRNSPPRAQGNQGTNQSRSVNGDPNARNVNNQRYVPKPQPAQNSQNQPRQPVPVGAPQRKPVNAAQQQQNPQMKYPQQYPQHQTSQQYPQQQQHSQQQPVFADPLGETEHYSPQQRQDWQQQQQQQYQMYHEQHLQRQYQQQASQQQAAQQHASQFYQPQPQPQSQQHMHMKNYPQQSSDLRMHGSPPRKPVPTSPDYNPNEANFRIPPAGYDVSRSINRTANNGTYRKPVGSN